VNEVKCHCGTVFSGDDAAQLYETHACRQSFLRQVLADADTSDVILALSIVAGVVILLVSLLTSKHV
jgi:hypothetical protein